MHPVKTPRSRLISSLSQSWSPLDTSRVDTSKVLELAPASDGCLGWGRMRKMVPSSYPEKSPKDPCPSSTHSKISQYMSITHTPGALQSTVSMLCLRPVYLACCLFNHGDFLACCLLALPEFRPADFSKPDIVGMAILVQILRARFS